MKIPKASILPSMPSITPLTRPVDSTKLEAAWRNLNNKERAQSVVSGSPRIKSHSIQLPGISPRNNGIVSLDVDAGNSLKRVPSLALVEPGNLYTHDYNLKPKIK